jgi:esterase/lipase superfamily enzyme
MTLDGCAQRVSPLCVRLLFCAGLVVAGKTAAYAQTLVAEKMPPACEEVTADAPADLQKRKESLEAEIARQQKGNKILQRFRANSLRENQEKLLDVLFKIECLPKREQLAQAPQYGTTRSIGKPAPATSNVIEVTTYYATNRKPTGVAEAVKFYGSEASGKFDYGRAVVTIPLVHTPGTVELPSIWKLERQVDPNKHFTLKSVSPLDVDAARKELADKLQSAKARTLLLFVHGYNVSFAYAALRTAQMAHDLQFPGLAFFYSWPSAGLVRGYWQDEEAARLSESVFEQLVEDLSQLPIDSIYLIAHSMGGRIVSHALQSRADKGKETKQVRELLLAAPDINAEIFRNVIAPKLSAMEGLRTTIYASSSDMALKASNVVHGFRRVGETAGGIFTFPRLETVDASGASNLSKGYGHLYVVDSASVIRDMQAIILRGISAKLRGLKEIGASPAPYWQLPEAAGDGSLPPAPPR